MSSIKSRIASRIKRLLHREPNGLSNVNWFNEKGLKPRAILQVSPAVQPNGILVNFGDQCVYWGLTEALAKRNFEVLRVPRTFIAPNRLKGQQPDPQRFHGALRGVSETVPTVTTSWSHKYPQLYTDLSLPPKKFILGGEGATNGSFVQSLDALVAAWNNRSETREILKRKVPGIRERVNQFVDDVCSVNYKHGNASGWPGKHG